MFGVMFGVFAILGLFLKARSMSISIASEVLIEIPNLPPTKWSRVTIDHNTEQQEEEETLKTLKREIMRSLNRFKQIKFLIRNSEILSTKGFTAGVK